MPYVPENATASWQREQTWAVTGCAATPVFASTGPGFACSPWQVAQVIESVLGLVRAIPCTLWSNFFSIARWHFAHVPAMLSLPSVDPGSDFFLMPCLP